MEMWHLLLLSLAVISQTVQGDGVSRVGNAIQGSSSGVDTPGATFLINDFVLADGVLFAFRAYFRSDKPLYFQIWRPVAANDTSSDDDFSLVAGWRVIPSIVDDIEDIYITAKMLPCALVHSGDRLALSFTESPGAVAYVFDSSDPNAHGKTLDPASPPIEGDVVEFDPMIFPYDFSVAAYVDTDYQARLNISEENYNNECPTNLLIPDQDLLDDMTPSPPVTGAPGAQGPSGPAGPVGAAGPGGPAGIAGVPGASGTDGVDGSVGATGMQGPQGDTGLSGFNGTMGGTGLQGIQGIAGPAGPAGASGAGASTGGDLTAGSITSIDTDSMSFVYLIWLAILTIIVIITLITLGCFITRRKRETKSHFHKNVDRELSLPDVEWNRKASLRPYGNPDSYSTPYKSPENESTDIPSISQIDDNTLCEGNNNEYNEDWMGTMKSTTEIYASNATLNEVEDSQSGGDSNLSTAASNAPIV